MELFRVLRLAFMILTVLALIYPKCRPLIAPCFLMGVYCYVVENRAIVRYVLSNQFVEEPSRVFWIHCGGMNKPVGSSRVKHLPRFVPVALHFKTGDILKVEISRKDVENVMEWFRGLNPAAFSFDPLQINNQNSEPCSDK